LSRKSTFEVLKEEDEEDGPCKLTGRGGDEVSIVDSVLPAAIDADGAVDVAVEADDADDVEV
jgi:hypothetical protein